MSKAFYPKMALSNISKNRKTYFPYIITCILTIMMYYMMNSILNNHSIRTMQGGDNVCLLVNIGLWITGIFAVIFLFYTNSFLIKRRNKEIGLYNILGMEKRHIGKMMLYETLFTAVVSIIFGILFGIVFGRLAFLLLMKLIAMNAVLVFEIPGISVVQTLLLSLGIFFAILLYNLAKIQLTKPIEMIHGGQIGEKEPKTKIILTIVGLVTLGGGYYFGIFVDSPFAAVSFFLFAVILVIIGTYCLFTAGSIALIKLLKKNKKFYYQAKHFTTVSGMMFRMKQNAVGLANICILATMVLISVSTTVSLFLGAEDAVESGYPSEININITSETDHALDEVEQEVNSILTAENVNANDYVSVNTLTIYGMSEKGSDVVNIVDSESSIDSLSSKVRGLTIITVDEFNEINNSDYALDSGNILFYSKSSYNCSDVIINSANGMLTYQISEKLDDITDRLYLEQASAIVGVYLIVVDNEDTLNDILTFCNEGVDPESNLYYYVDSEIQFNTELSKADSIALNTKINEIELDDILVKSNNQYDERDQMHQAYGSFLFIGIFVGTLFMMATVLIIYYKQISEGYDDKERFEIMQKVGMSKEEVKKSIHSQVLTVFFLPLIVATIHVIVSFRIIKMILNMLALGNTELFIWCTCGTVLVFCIIYAIVFSVTAKSYYNIVGTKM